MPEAPECRRTAEELNELLADSFIYDIAILSGRYKRHGEPDGMSKLRSLMPIKINRVHVKGKFIWFELDKEVTIWNTLGMSGRWTTKPTKHSHVLIDTQENKTYFDDVRNFGTLKICFDKNKLKKKLASLGPDILDSNNDLPSFKKRLELDGLKTKPVVEALMNQGVISGIGNYIKAEALYRARVSPHRLCGDLSPEDRNELCIAVLDIARESYDAYGLSIRDYISPAGKKGVFQLQIYGKTGPGIIREATSDGRTTYWVPEIQK